MAQATFSVRMDENLKNQFDILASAPELIQYLWILDNITDGIKNVREGIRSRDGIFNPFRNTVSVSGSFLWWGRGVKEE